ncbi:cysteine hydrolase family protein [Pseudomonas viridiflava]|jgi:Amidases related to nicotinamidase|uniref:cysteine hydrolase family protein n=1 Tax=Pseudomonas viridiflava TaxID=33069 RepID=UPI00083F9164|nr:cysteine hydrolase family protein [Pseudomonas viridiflava]MEE3916457.1 cysteine hydrolase family protein [Pseudomonas viridiflava]MEE3975369.1 cysteine hydrolase family protein [Pseudomonas viridiflava]MEE4018916.1 cysteine hydrolase family protein [Pseudomonas viridiflava]MEE4045630.1 cysteine hydrolase family protein [Pseudomonas viridiflava]ODJ93160.1 isochorismatase [Pseudomonas viridiflava]
MDIRPDSALILIDMQKGINHPKLGRRNNPQAEARMSELLSAWREAGRPVIHVRHFSTSPSSVFWPEQSGVEYQPAFVPQADERELSKQVPDAFCGSFLEMWLRSDGIRQMVIAGVVTNNSVESTARSGGNLGFEVIVAHDACFTFDQADFFGTPRSAEDVHAMSLANLHGEYATVLSTAQILDQR